MSRRASSNARSPSGRSRGGMVVALLWTDDAGNLPCAQFGTARVTAKSLRNAQETRSASRTRIHASACGERVLALPDVRAGCIGIQGGAYNDRMRLLVV